MTDGEPIVRRARPGDEDGFARVIELVAGEGDYILTEPPVDVQTFAKRVRALAEAGGPDVLWVVEGADGEILGNLGLHPRDAGLVTLGMALLPEARGLGLGRRLLDAGVEHARSRGWHKVHLEVFPTNEVAIGLYRSAGFEVEGRLREHYRRRDGRLADILVLGLRL